MIAPTGQLTDALRLFGDPTRLRILGLLELAELSVGELARALELQQSRVSNHLRVLRDAHLLAERHEGRATFLRVASPHDDAPDLNARLWTTVRAEVPTLPEFTSDVARLQHVLDERRKNSRAFFDRVASDWDTIGVDFSTGQARQRAAASLLARPVVLADLGCGTGYFARALAGLCSKLVCVDASTAMLDEARRKLEPLPPGTELELRRGELDDLPLADRELDGCVAGMVLHHLEEPHAALREMRRVLKPGASAVVVELMPHRETWMQTELGDRHLGLDPRDVLRAFQRAGFEGARLEPVEDRYQPKRRTTSAEAPEAGVPDNGAEPAALPMYLVRGRAPSGVS